MSTPIDPNLQLSSTEIDAMYRLSHRSILLTDLSAKNDKDLHGWTQAGLTVYNKLVKKGLAMVTEEDLIDEDDPAMGTWTPTVQLTPEGEAWWKHHEANPSEPVAPKPRAPRC